MSVMAETSQSAMGPYVAMAAVGSVLYAWTAVCREALVVKVPGGDGGDGGGGLGGGGEGEGGGCEGGGLGGLDGEGAEGGNGGGEGDGGGVLGGGIGGDEGGVIPTYWRRPMMFAAWRSSMASSFCCMATNSSEQPQVGGGEGGGAEGEGESQRLQVSLQLFCTLFFFVHLSSLALHQLSFFLSTQRLEGAASSCFSMAASSADHGSVGGGEESGSVEASSTGSHCGRQAMPSCFSCVCTPLSYSPPCCWSLGGAGDHGEVAAPRHRLTSNSPRTPSSSAAWSTAAPSSSTAIASSSSEHLQVDGGKPSPDPEPSPPSIVAAPNLGAGGDGEVAALTHSSTQKAASHLIRRGPGKRLGWDRLR